MPIVFPTSPTVGQLFTEAGRSWVWTGSSWDAPTTNNALQIPFGLELVKTQEIGTGVSSVEVIDAFSSKYDNYRIVVTGGAGSTNVALRLKLGAASNGHSSVLVYGAYTGGSPALTVQSNGALWTTIGIVDTNQIFGNIEVMQPFIATQTVVQATYVDSANAGMVVGRHSGATSFTSFTISPGSGTITGGTILVYGYRKA